MVLSGVPGGAIAAVAFELSGWQPVIVCSWYRCPSTSSSKKENIVGKHMYSFIYILHFLLPYNDILSHARICQPLLLFVIRIRRAMDTSGRRSFELGNPDLLSHRFCALNAQGSFAALCTDLAIPAFEVLSRLRRRKTGAAR